MITLHASNVQTLFEGLTPGEQYQVQAPGLAGVTAMAPPSGRLVAEVAGGALTVTALLRASSNSSALL
jgi:hypothetical protein